jgi:hypothetical protein
MEQVLEVGQGGNQASGVDRKVMGQTFKPEQLTKYGHSLK